MNHAWRWLRLLLGVLILVLLAQRLGSAPFVAGVRNTSAWALAVALVVTAGTTWCCAVRWSLVAGRLGTPVSVREAYGACYRSQLVNATLPGGVVGDVHRATRHGWRGVVWERGLGQGVQVVLTVLALVLLPSPFDAIAGVFALVAVAGAVVVGMLCRRDLRRLLTADLAGPVLVLSAAAVAGHLLVLVVAARTAGLELPVATLVPVGALVLSGAAIPTNVAGWGPREGVAAWAFAATGVGRRRRADRGRDVRRAVPGRHLAGADGVHRTTPHLAPWRRTGPGGAPWLSVPTRC